MNGNGGKVLAGLFREHRQRMKALRVKPCPQRADVEELSVLFEELATAYEEVCEVAERSSHPVPDEVVARVLRRLHGPEWELMLKVLEERRRSGQPTSKLEDFEDSSQQQGTTASPRSSPETKAEDRGVAKAVGAGIVGVAIGVAATVFLSPGQS